jgi:serine/threonine protein kinase/Flp pilus assembly protein TadD
MATLTHARWNPVELEQCVEAFESAWKKMGIAAVHDFVPPQDDPAYGSVLCELVRIDIEYHWSRGDRRGLDDYLSEFPILRRDPELLQQIAYEEYRQRLQAGETVDRDSYQARFEIDVSSWPESSEIESSALIELRTRKVEREEMRNSTGAEARNSERPEKTRMPKIGDVLVHFRIVGNLGDGAFGQVYLAEQTDLSNRNVALKVTSDANAEPQLMAELQHANIVPINSVHRFGKLQIICMPYHGSTTLKHVMDEVGKTEGSFPSTGRAFLSTLFDRSKSSKSPSSNSLPAVSKPDSGVRRVVSFDELPPIKRLSELEKLADMSQVDAALRIVHGVTEGLVHAHDRGLIHRDLKPANILLADDGTPMLLDFNLAAHTTDAKGMTRMRMGGTFPYMAPEQLDAIRRKQLSRDPRSDLYALGVILYELLTGRHPFPKNKCVRQDFLDQMVADRRRPIADPRQINKAIPAAVASVVTKLLAAEPVLRYQSAVDLKDDLERQLESRPLKHAMEWSLRERAVKFRRRHPRLFTAIAVSALVLLPATLASGSFAESARRSRERNRAEAVLRMNDSLDKCTLATAYLSERNSAARVGKKGLRLVEELFAQYGMRSDGAWAADSEIARLTEPEQQRLMRGLGEMMITTADMKRRWADDANDTALRDEAMTWNRLAETCYVRAGQVPDRVKWQRDLLSGKSGEKPGKDLPQLAKMDEADLYAAACNLVSELKYREALVLLDELTSRDPTHFLAWYYKGSCCDSLGLDEKAIRAWTVCVALKPEFPNGFANRARALMRRGEHREAILDLDRALTLEPSLTTALIQRADAKRGFGDFSGAESDLTTALTHDGAPTRIYFLRAMVYQSLGKKIEADRDLAEGMKQEPQDEVDYTFRGCARLKDDPTAALRDFNKALNLNPRHQPALLNKAYLFGDVFGKTELALGVVNEMLRLHPYDLTARCGRGVYNARLGRVREAREDAAACVKYVRDGRGFFHLACLYSLLSPHDSEARDESIRFLTLAIQKGGSRPEELRTDKDLDPIRQDSEFNRLVQLATTGNK